MEKQPNPSSPHSKQVYVRDLKPKDRVQTTLMVKSKDLLYAKDGKPYLSLILTDRTGDIEGRMWDGAEALSELTSDGDILAIWGKVHSYQNRLQVVVENAVVLPPEEFCLEDFVPSSHADLDKLYSELLDVFENVKEPNIRAVALSLLKDPEIASRYKRCPAAKTIHHAYIGGLLTHSLQLIRLVDAIASFYPDLSRDLMVFGAAFHDFGKIFELSYDSSFSYTDEGRLVGHITIGATLLDRHIRALPSFPRQLEYQLKHLILSHHGKLEFGSPKRPATLEAEVVHLLDTLDSKVESIVSFMKAEKSPSRWTGYHKAYDQYYYRPDALVPDSSKSPRS